MSHIVFGGGGGRVNAFFEETVTATGAGSSIDVRQFGLQNFGIQIKGTGAAATSWSVRIEGSIDGNNFDTVLTHNTTVGDGKIVWTGASRFPCRYVRINTTELTLGSATNIKVFIFSTY